MATPHVSGVAALIWSLAPNATAAQIRDALLDSAHDIGDSGHDNVFGYGVVDAFAAANRLAPSRFSGQPRRRSIGH
jgi:serine protease